ncbi:ClpP/crotonase [Pseudovirgaria hyperparasitica]|uniref:ClpP/crotonase n=1 Tax=Pseudovirgaria hyperparasitica TaxID=470096 RepID=A0A6A6VZ46_9PEZI|nr:ClpP/crotonase [Pseudovirgaria hyperparasitica]KAF2755922.1 ClpP/crotonase [Pseudovirgaria hyperparasitica]
MRILFLCTAHNSLSQRLYLALSPSHDVTIELAISEDVMITAAELARPDVVICPFLTARVPKVIYDNYTTLIVHPGPPGDVGPSALDWVLLGDDGSIENATELLKILDNSPPRPGRTHWGVTVLQAIEEFDAGPVWAFEQFPLDIDERGLTKSSLYRGPVSRAAISSVLVAVSRIQETARVSAEGRPCVFHKASPDFRHLSIENRLPFQGGRLFHRPLLKAAQRNFDVTRHTAQQISRRIRCGDSQPGALSNLFGLGLYLYGGLVDETPGGPNSGVMPAASPGTIVGIRNDALCITTCDGKGVWISHIRRVKKSSDVALWPKIPAVSGLLELGLLDIYEIENLYWSAPPDWSRSPFATMQDVWVELSTYNDSCLVAYLHWEFYNGAMSSSQCSRLVEAMDYILSTSTPKRPIHAVVLMGGSYFSNGIDLNVIEASQSPAEESWININRIDDVVQYLLLEFPRRNVLTIGALRGNAAAGGVALAAACDVVIAGSEIVLSPAYRGVGLYGSEYHTISYPGRCGAHKAKEILQSMTPMSPFEARCVGLVDHVLIGSGFVLDEKIRTHVPFLLKSVLSGHGFWKSTQDLSAMALSKARTLELCEMSKDFFSARSVRYHSRRFNFVRKVKNHHTPLRFARHRRLNSRCLDEEEKDSFDDVRYYQRQTEYDLVTRLEAELQNREVDSSQSKVEILKKAAEPLFSCYYKAVDEVFTPPRSPSASHEETAKNEVPI